MLIRTLNYGNVTIVESNVIRVPYDTYVNSVMDINGDWYDIYALAEDGTLVAILDESLDE